MMLLPMMGFFFMLVVVGGIASLAVMIDTHAARRAPFPFAVFFAGITAIIFVIIGGLVSYVSDTAGGFIVLLLAPTLGLIAGGILGYRLGLIRRRYASEDPS